MYFVYILRSTRDRSKYIGCTNDLKRRIAEHNRGEVKFTSTRHPYKLIWFACFADKEKAYTFEKYLKSSSGYAFTSKHLI